MPSISVLMPVYNGQSFLQESIESILNQTFPDFEFIIVDDGSTDDSAGIIQKYMQRDSRIRLIRNPRNQGLIDALTLGNQSCTGKYIARMDADDISRPDRLKMQWEYMQSHPEIDVLGSNTAYIDEKGNLLKGKLIEPSDPVQVWLQMFFRCSIHHPTILAKAEIYKRFNENGLERSYLHAEDYAFWLRMGFSCKYANLNALLHSSRRHEGSVSAQFRETQRTNQLLAAKKAYQAFLGRDIPLSVLRAFMFSKYYVFPDRSLNLEALQTMDLFARKFMDEYSLSGKEKAVTSEYLIHKILFFADNPAQDWKLRLAGVRTCFMLSPVHWMRCEYHSWKKKILLRLGLGLP
jgi:glycosyltransferase involved in cell wall biosynthesis